MKKPTDCGDYVESPTREGCDYKVWIGIEECDGDGHYEEMDLPLLGRSPGSAGFVAPSYEEALAYAQAMHELASDLLGDLEAVLEYVERGIEDDLGPDDVEPLEDADPEKWADAAARIGEADAREHLLLRGTGHILCSTARLRKAAAMLRQEWGAEAGE